MESFFGLLFCIVYFFFGYQANQWCKYHLLGVRAEMTSDLGNFFVSRIIWAAILGWITIPIMIIGIFLQKK